MTTKDLRPATDSGTAWVEIDGYKAGLNAEDKPCYQINCPYDGRTREGKAWWFGFLRGNTERSAGPLRPVVKLDSGREISTLSNVELRILAQRAWNDLRALRAEAKRRGLNDDWTVEPSDFISYCLPDRRIVQVPFDVCRAASTIEYETAKGIVLAVIVEGER